MYKTFIHPYFLYAIEVWGPQYSHQQIFLYTFSLKFLESYLIVKGLLMLGSITMEEYCILQNYMKEL